MKKKEKESNKKGLGIIGFGRFGQLMAEVLRPYFDITIFDPRDTLNISERIGVTDGRELKHAAQKPIVILAVPVFEFEKVIKDVAKHVKKNALVIDVSSVKVKPSKLMHKHLPKGVRIIPTHPLFGPESCDVKKGIDGLRVVVCADKKKKYVASVIKFLRDELNLKVLVKSEIEHDKEMAYVQAITHFVGKAINTLSFPDSDQSTLSYLRLQESAFIVRNDTDELFKTIENENPYAKEVRKKFLRKLREIENWLAD